MSENKLIVDASIVDVNTRDLLAIIQAENGRLYQRVYPVFDSLHTGACACGWRTCPGAGKHFLDDNAPKKRKLSASFLGQLVNQYSSWAKIHDDECVQNITLDLRVFEWVTFDHDSR